MFTIGQDYKRREIHAKYGGQVQGGISTPKGLRAVLLFIGQSGAQHGYSDYWLDDSTFILTGEGQFGDMVLMRGNAAIRDHVADGKALYLFEYVRSGWVRYVDEMVCTGFHRELLPDSNKVTREAIVFELKRVDAWRAPRSAGAMSTPAIVVAGGTLSLAQLREKAQASAVPVTTAKERVASYRERSMWIREYAVRRAGGKCEACQHAAPFVSATGQPYLEVHHIHKLSDDGPDDPQCVAALCPNCHRRAHYSGDSAAFNVAIAATVSKLEKQ